jgi:hypothetical protein
MKRLLWFCLLIIFQAQARPFYDFDSSNSIEVSFSSPYPVSSFKKIKTLATQLWSQVNEGLEDGDSKEQFEYAISDFAHSVLDLNTLCDLLVADFGKELHGPSRRYHPDLGVMFEELYYLFELVHALDQMFDQVMDGHMSDQAACVKVVLDRIQSKMERTLKASAP